MEDSPQKRPDAVTCSTHTYKNNNKNNNNHKSHKDISDNDNILHVDVGSLLSRIFDRQRRKWLLDNGFCDNLPGMSASRTFVLC